MLTMKCFVALVTAALLSATEGRKTRISSRQEPIDLGPGDTLGPSYPSDTEYVELSVAPFFLAMSIEQYANVYGDFPDCGPVTASKGADMYIGTNREEGCGVATLKLPLCTTREEGLIKVYVRKPYLSAGQESDNAFLTSFDIPISFPGFKFEWNSPFQFFRIQNPTVLTLQDRFLSSREVSSPSYDGDFRIGVLDDGSPVFIPAEIVADPACYSNSTCAMPFFEFQDVAEPECQVISDLCGGTLSVSSGEEINLLSHTRIGCEAFPSTYASCVVNFSGSGATTLKITMTDFVGTDACDGFDVRVGVNDGNQESVYDLCQSTVTEIQAPLGSGYISVGGSSLANREKYGFIINVSA